MIWALELENGLCHRLGMAKPLGLGVVQITISETSFWMRHDPIKRYYEQIDSKPKKEKLDVVDLKREAIDKYTDTINYKDLKSILSIDTDIMESVKYPKAGSKGDYVGYQWFMEHKDQPLYTIEEIKSGKRQTGWKGKAA